MGSAELTPMQAWIAPSFWVSAKSRPRKRPTFLGFGIGSYGRWAFALS